jgi:hypothetical protein
MMGALRGAAIAMSSCFSAATVQRGQQRQDGPSAGKAGAPTAAAADNPAKKNAKTNRNRDANNPCS